MPTPYHQLSRRALLLILIERQDILMAKIDDLTAQVAQNNTVIGSATVLINGISTRLDNAVAEAKAGNDAQMVSLQNDLKTNDDQLAAAVAANTGATGTPPATPPAPAAASRL